MQNKLMTYFPWLATKIGTNIDSIYKNRTNLY